VLRTSLLWRSTVAFTYLKVKSVKCLCLLPVVLVLVLLVWSWSCKQRSLSWSFYFGLGFGLKNLVLFTSLFAGTCNFVFIKDYACRPVSIQWVNLQVSLVTNSAVCCHYFLSKQQLPTLLQELINLLTYYGRTLSERPCYILPMFF